LQKNWPGKRYKTFAGIKNAAREYAESHTGSQGRKNPPLQNQGTTLSARTKNAQVVTPAFTQKSKAERETVKKNPDGRTFER